MGKHIVTTETDPAPHEFNDAQEAIDFIRTTKGRAELIEYTEIKVTAFLDGKDPHEVGYLQIETISQKGLL